MALFAVKTKSPKYETAKNIFEFSYTLSNKWTNTNSMLVSVSSKTTFERQSMFQRSENDVLKGATIKGKNMLPIGSIFFPLKVATRRIENIFKCCGCIKKRYNI